MKQTDRRPYRKMAPWLRWDHLSAEAENPPDASSQRYGEDQPGRIPGALKGRVSRENAGMELHPL